MGFRRWLVAMGWARGLCCILVLLSLAGWGRAAELSGAGTEHNPYRIGSVAEWAIFATTPAYWTSGTCTILTADIDFASANATEAIGLSEEASFAGTLDGRGYTLIRYGMAYDNPGSNDGVFSTVSGCVKNLRLERAILQSSVTDNAGILAGTVAPAGKIINCHVTDCVVSAPYSSMVGGLVGNCKGVMVGCSARKTSDATGAQGVVAGTFGVGGLVGGSDGNSAVIAQSWAMVAVGSESGQYVGGFAGVLGNAGRIENCYSRGAVCGSEYVGGFVGQVNAGTVLNSYCTGTVQGTISGGAFVDSVEDAILTSCAYRDDDGETEVTVSGGSLTSQPGDLLARTSAELKDAATLFNGTSDCWDFLIRANDVYNDSDGSDDIWMTNPFRNDGYPFIAAPVALDGQYQIADVWHLRWLAERVNNGVDTAPSCRQVCDIDAAEAVFWRPNEDGETYRGFNPIGNGECAFQGMYQGGGFVIRNLPINDMVSSQVGLFGTIRGTEGETRVAGVNIGNAVVIGYEQVGILAGVLDNAGIEDCVLSGQVMGFGMVGGAIGEMAEGAYIGNCQAFVSVGIGNNTGGLIGKMTAAMTYVDACTVTGTVSGEVNVGGLVGATAGGEMYNSWTDVTVTGTDLVGGIIGAGSGGAQVKCCRATGQVAAAGAAGGVAGRVYGADVRECITAAAVWGGEMAGGIAGYMVPTLEMGGECVSGARRAHGPRAESLGGPSSSVAYCSSKGAVDGAGTVGGLVGACILPEGMEGDAGITQSYATGATTGNGLIGSGAAPSMARTSISFFDSSTSGATAPADNARLYSAMRQLSTFSNEYTSGWNSYIWNVVDTKTRPFLNWEEVAVCNGPCSGGKTLTGGYVHVPSEVMTVTEIGYVYEQDANPLDPNLPALTFSSGLKAGVTSVTLTYDQGQAIPDAVLSGLTGGGVYYARAYARCASTTRVWYGDTIRFVAVGESSGNGNGGGAGGDTVPQPPADLVPPMLYLNSPCAWGQIRTATSPALAFSGTSSDAVGVTAVEWSLSGASGGMGTSSLVPVSPTYGNTFVHWSGNAALREGLTTVTVKALDAAGNSSTGSFTVYWAGPVRTPVVQAPADPAVWVPGDALPDPVAAPGVFTAYHDYWAAQPTPLPGESTGISTKPVCKAGEPIEVYVNAKTMEWMDIYIGFVMPGGLLFCLDETMGFCECGMVKPAATNIGPAAITGFRAVRDVLPAGMPAGQYLWTVVLVRTGTSPLDANNIIASWMCPFAVGQ